MDFMTAVYHKILGDTFMISRCGYTGEDGFEINVPIDKSMQFTDLLFKEKLGTNEQIVMATGLGARDSLRLEAGLCLYGNDLNETISPIEALLLWTVGKRRREEGGFLGFDRVKKEIADGVGKKRCGFITKGPSAREGSKIFDKEGNEVGLVTSGTYSPSLKIPFGMAYVNVPLNKVEICLIL